MQRVIGEQTNITAHQSVARETIEQELRGLRLQLTTLTDLRVRSLISDDEYLARRREIDVAQIATEERLSKAASGADWFEPAQLLIFFGNQAIS